MVFGLVHDWLLEVDFLLGAGSLPWVGSLRNSLQLQLLISKRLLRVVTH
jgi:hypothetical protein